MAWYPRQPLPGSAGKDCGVLRLAPDGWGEYSGRERKLGLRALGSGAGEPGPRVLISILVSIGANRGACRRRSLPGTISAAGLPLAVGSPAAVG